MLVVTSKKYKPLDFPCSDSGTDYLGACILDRYTATIEFYFEKKALYKRLKFDSGTKTITNYNNVDFDSFLALGFLVGEKIKIVHSGGLNQGELTITDVSDRIITVSNALTDEITKSGSIYVTSKVTDLEYFYNLTTKGQNQRRKPLSINFDSGNPKRNADAFLSETDEGVLQKYTASALDCEDTSTHKIFKIGTDSYAWVSDIGPQFTGSASVSYIVGAGIDVYKQKFKIVHAFGVAPYFLVDQFGDFKGKTIPKEFLSDSLGYQFQINAKYNASPTIGDFYVTIDERGETAWYDQNVTKTRPEYTLDSISYKDNADDSDLPRLDFTKVCKVKIRIKSESGKFVSGVGTGTYMMLNHLYCPLDKSVYEQTATNENQNYLKDFAFNRIGQPGINGVAYGSAYQAIKEYAVTLIDANTADLNFKIDYSTQNKTFFSTRGDADRNYCFVVTTQDILNTTNEGIDRVPVRCGFDNMDYTQKDATLLELVDYIRNYHYPAMDVNPKNNIKGFEGLPIYSEIPFRINTGTIIPILKSCGVQIIATKTGKPDFILEEKIFTLDNICNYGDAQDVNIEESRNFNSFPGNPYNIASLKRSTAYDTGAKKGFVMHYGFVLRYEDWISILSNDCPPIQNDNKTLSQRWADIANGWSLSLRFIADVEGSGGFVTEYQASVPITIKKEGATPDTGPIYTPTIYFLDENDIKIDSILEGGITKIVAQFEVQPLNVADEVLGNTAAATLTYDFTLVNKNIVPATLRITNSSENFFDNGDGTLSGNLGGTGTINYDTGEVEITFASQPTFPFAINATAYSYYPTLTSANISGTMFADQKNQTGGIAGRRFASTDIPSEEDSPWSAPPQNPDASISWAIGNLRVNLFGASRFTVEGLYDEGGSSSGGNSSFRCGSTGIYIGVVINQEDFRLWDDLTPHLWDDLSPAAF